MAITHTQVYGRLALVNTKLAQLGCPLLGLINHSKEKLRLIHGGCDVLHEPLTVSQMYYYLFGMLMCITLDAQQGYHIHFVHPVSNGYRSMLPCQED